MGKGGMGGRHAATTQGFSGEGCDALAVAHPRESASSYLFSQSLAASRCNLHATSRPSHSRRSLPCHFLLCRVILFCLVLRRRRLRAQPENRALSWVVSCWVGLWLGWVVPREVGSSARRVRSRPPPLTPADGHHRCFWLRHRPRRAPCARRRRASNVIDRAACCVDAFFWLSSRAFCVPAGGRICVV